MKKFIALTAVAALATAPAFACNSMKTTTANADAPRAVLASHHTETAGTIVDVAVANDFTTLVAAVKAAGLAETLSGEGPFTVFAPTDDAFAAVGQDTLDSLLLPENKEKLAGILKYHVISGKVKAADLAGAVTEAETLNGTVTVDGTDGVTVVNGAKVIMADVKASNGVVHVIDTVLMPPKKEKMETSSY